jgi:hypothetical protein
MSPGAIFDHPYPYDHQGPSLLAPSSEFESWGLTSVHPQQESYIRRTGNQSPHRFQIHRGKPKSAKTCNCGRARDTDLLTFFLVSYFVLATGTKSLCLSGRAASATPGSEQALPKHRLRSTALTYQLKITTQRPFQKSSPVLTGKF